MRLELSALAHCSQFVAGLDYQILNPTYKNFGESIIVLGTGTRLLSVTLSMVFRSIRYSTRPLRKYAASRICGSAAGAPMRIQAGA